MIHTLPFDVSENVRFSFAQNSNYLQINDMINGIVFGLWVTDELRNFYNENIWERTTIHKLTRPLFMEKRATEK